VVRIGGGERGLIGCCGRGEGSGMKGHGCGKFSKEPTVIAGGGGSLRGGCKKGKKNRPKGGGKGGRGAQ